MNLSWLVPLINHPGVPWGAGGFVGAIVGFFAGQPTNCHYVRTSASFLLERVCDPAQLPIVGAITLEPAMALGTLLGAAIFGFSKLLSK